MSGYEGIPGQTFGYCKIMLKIDFFMHQVLNPIEGLLEDTSTYNWHGKETCKIRARAPNQ